MSGHDFAVPSGVPQPYDQQQHYAGAAATRAHQAGAVYGSPISYQLTPPIPGSSTLQQEENPYDTNDWQHHGRSASSHSSPNQQSAAGTNSASASTMKKTTVQNRSAMACLLCRKQKVSPPAGQGSYRTTSVPHRSFSAPPLGTTHAIVATHSLPPACRR